MKKNNPIFSVIIPTYNREELVCNAIESVLNQTFDDFEIIIVDDGSTDNTFELVKNYHEKRIIYAYKQNGGQNTANNIALRLARGEYVAFLDSDDIWTKDKLKKTYEKFMSDPELGVVYNYTGMRENGVIILGRDDKVEGRCYKEVLGQGYMTSPSFLSCKRSCFDVIGEFDEEQQACQDDDLCFKLCKHFKVGLIKEILGVYGVAAGNQITKNKKRGADYYLRLLEKYKDEIIRECGVEMMIRKYTRAKRLYNEINETQMIEDINKRIEALTV